MKPKPPPGPRLKAFTLLPDLELPPGTSPQDAQSALISHVLEHISIMETQYTPCAYPPVQMRDLTFLASALGSYMTLLDECRESRLAFFRAFSDIRPE